MPTTSVGVERRWLVGAPLASSILPDFRDWRKSLKLGRNRGAVWSPPPTTTHDRGMPMAGLVDSMAPSLTPPDWSAPKCLPRLGFWYDMST
ncbi:hypothetical protein CRG98_039113 [Punica granatum]|uniref:Uncharacterized protein n=1 Tax=Punica granatum TaxID=22663 RepID=A0A2I0I905_PUNGR|nr:hypothetical protein CRG98_039113 [Punica granatum]